MHEKRPETYHLHSMLLWFAQIDADLTLMAKPAGCSLQAGQSVSKLLIGPSATFQIQVRSFNWATCLLSFMQPVVLAQLTNINSVDAC